MKEYDKEVTTILMPTESIPSKLYGLIKVRKEGNPAKLVVSIINTLEYKLVKFSDSISNHMIQIHTRF